MGEVHSCLASCDAKRNGAKIKAREVPQQGDFPIDKRVPVRAPCYLLSAPLTRGPGGEPPTSCSGVVPTLRGAAGLHGKF